MRVIKDLQVSHWYTGKSWPEWIECNGCGARVLVTVREFTDGKRTYGSAACRCGRLNQVGTGELVPPKERKANE